MNRRDYYELRRMYRKAQHDDTIAEREANKALQEFKAYGFRSFGGDPNYITITDRADAVLSILTPRERAAVLAAPAPAEGRGCRLPLGPRASAIYYRGNMDLNRRVALRRAIRQADAYAARRAG